MSWHFWLIPLVILWSFGFRRRWKYIARYHKRRRREEEVQTRDPELASELESQRGYIGELESRVAELENRLDFTERLLATRANSTESVGQ
jgi:uncharacterized protein YlxW (UPF0749 family)